MPSGKQKELKTRLTQSLVGQLEPAPEGKYRRTWDTEVPGFFVRMTPKGVGTYYIRYRSPVSFKDQMMSIGRINAISLKEARQIAMTLSGDVARGHDPQAERKAAKAEAKRLQSATLQGFLDKQYEPYLKAVMKNGDRTAAEIRSVWANELGRELTAFNSVYLIPWRNERLKEVTPATANRNTAILRALLNKAVEWGAIPNNPMAGFKQLKLDRSPNVRYLSDEEMASLRKALTERDRLLREERASANKWREARGYKLLPSIPIDGYGDHLTPIVVLALNTGMRRGEIFNLDWSHVNLTAKRLTVAGATAKSANTRHIPLSNEAAATLAQCHSQWGNESGLVFRSPRTGGRLDNISTSWENLMTQAGIKGFRFHDLRHHFASQLVMQNVDLNTVRELLGHATLDMTLRYAHLAPEHKAAAIALLNN